MFKNFFRSKQFLGGFCILATIIIASYAIENYVKIGQFKLTSEASPAPPSFAHPLGVGDYGIDVLQQVLTFAKTPIFYSLLIAFIRTLFSLIFGFLLAYSYKWTKWLDWILDPFQYVPTILLALFLLSPVPIMQIKQDNQWIFYTITVLVLIGIPNLTQLISSEIRLLLQHEFVTSSKTMGGRPFHIYKLHLKPYLIPKICIWFNQQVLQVFILMMHLALFQAISISIGGTVTLLSQTSEHLIRQPWVAFGPVIFFTIVILAMYMMMSGIKHVLETDINYSEESLLLNKLERERKENKRIHI
ncbi:ABC transporter permease subunit [Bacillus sp. DHT2]|uniref:ABC transporter permease n=1 Tax=Bacillus sp. DHT2 TaxID=2994532 RepID=UPI00224946C1|nr:ABC transporter permease subunit [Bacillus sp. DHT2]MCX2829058.1 ABC transporter permease subunit [Bacillus sp. DHT2]